MGWKVITTEKPSVARDIARVVGAKTKKEGYIEGNGYKVTWAVGHLVGLVEPQEYSYGWLSQKEMYDRTRPENIKKALEDLPMIPEDWKLKVLAKTRAQFKVMKTLLTADDTELVIDAGDAGPEGGVLQAMIRWMAGCKKPVKRFIATSMTDEAISEAMKHLEPIEKYELMVQGEFAKKKADWMLGMNMSRVETIKYHKSLPVGRVQTPTLAMVVARTKEVENFQPRDFYVMKALFKEGFEANWEKDDADLIDPKDKDSEGRVLNKEAITPVVGEIKKEGSGEVSSVSRAEKKENTPQLYDITTLQRDANKLYGFGAKKTLDLAQALYETHKIQTYPRTDSRYLTHDLVPYFKERCAWIGKCFGFEEPYKLLETQGMTFSKRIVDDSKVTDHHAIIVTEKINGFNFAKLSADESKILKLVMLRMLTAVAAPYVYNETKVAVKFANGFVFKTGVQVPVDKGWKLLAAKSKEEGANEAQEMAAKTLGQLTEGQRVLLEKVGYTQKTTTPPKLHTEATLLTAMEKAGSTLGKLGEVIKGRGIGTQATRAGIIDKLYTYEYMEKKKVGKTVYIRSTDKGNALIDIVPEMVTSAKLTAEIEEQLLDIQQGSVKAEDFIAKYAEIVTKMIDAEKNGEAKTFKGGNMEIAPQKEKCEGKWKGKPVSFTREWSGHRFTDEECEQLLAGEEITISGLVSKKGKEYNVKGKLASQSFKGHKFVGFQKTDFC